LVTVLKKLDITTTTVTSFLVFDFILDDQRLS